MQSLDSIGKKFGRWVVVGLSNRASGVRKVPCLCECGNKKNVRVGHLLSGKSTSCGCFSRDIHKRRLTTHGRSKTVEHNIWACMIQRCFNMQNTSYKDYGGRGISVCERWKSFENFYEDMGDRPSDKHSLDRINNDGNYCPENCRWAVRCQQANNRCTSKRITFNGKNQTAAEWCKEIGIRQGTLHNRLRRGWSIERALTTPVR